MKTKEQAAHYFSDGYSLSEIGHSISRHVINFLSRRCKPTKEDISSFKSIIKPDLEKLESMAENYNGNPLFNKVYMEIKKDLADIIKV